MTDENIGAWFWFALIGGLALVMLCWPTHYRDDTPRRNTTKNKD